MGISPELADAAVKHGAARAGLRRAGRLACVLALGVMAGCGGGVAEVQAEQAVLNDDAALATLASQEFGPGAQAALAESAAIGREQAQAVAASAAVPRTAALMLAGIHDPAVRAHVARFGMAIVDIKIGTGTTSVAAYVADLKARNPSLLLGQYVNVGSVRDTQSTLAQRATADAAWLRTATNERTQWTGVSDAYEINLTSWAPTNAAGKRWSQTKAEYDAARVFSVAPGVDFAYTDTVWPQTVSADWKRIGSNQSYSDSAVQSATRGGFNAYWAELKARRAGLQVVANAYDPWLSTNEFKGKLDGAVLNGMMGKAWATEERLGWAAMMSRYRTAISNTTGKKAVVFLMYAEPSDYASMRYGLASSMLEDGYFALWASSGAVAAPWYDEYSAPIGTAAEAPPTAATPSGIWVRKYSQGMVLVNPGSSNATINVGAGYARLSGSQDPAVNNGAAVTTVTLGPRQGLLLRAQPDASASASSSSGAAVAACSFAPVPGDTAGVYKPAARKDEATNAQVASQWAAAKSGGDVLFIGDSITLSWAYGGSYRATQWNSLAPGYRQVNMGVGGDTIQNVAYRVQAGLLRSSVPKAVVLLIGANNVSTSAPAGEVTGRAIANLAALIRCELPGTRLVLVGTLPRGVVGSVPDPVNDPILINQVKRIDAEIARLHAASPVAKAFVDASPAFMSGAGLNLSLYKDQVHLLDAGYGAYAQQLGPALRNALAN